MNLLLRQGLRHHARKPLSTLLTLLGIAAGTALLCAMRLSEATATNAFDRAVAAVAGRATHVVDGGAEGVPVSAYVEIRRRLRGVGVAPSIVAIARVPDRDERTVLRVLGVDPFADVELRPWAGVGSGDVPVAQLLTTPGAFVATETLLARLGIGAGERLPLAVGGRALDAVCAGVLSVPPALGPALDDALLVDIATAQQWTGRLDRVDRLELRLAPESLPPDLPQPELALAMVREAVGPGPIVRAAGAQQRGLRELTRGFRLNVTALSLLSLLVGAFLVHETMRLSVVARRGSFGVLRALGVAPRRLFASVALEALLLGVVGSVLGAALGVLAAQALLDPIVRTLNDHYATFAAPPLDVDPAQLGLGVTLGLVATLLAALGPALAASRVSPREVLLTAAAAGARQRSRRQWLVASAVLLVVAATLLATVGDRLVQGYFGMLALLLAAVLVVPTAMQLLLRAVDLLAARGGPFVRYTVRSTLAARDHLALPLAAMMLALATTIGIAVLVQSFRSSVGGWLGQVLPADVYVAVPGGVDERGAPILPAIVASLRTAPGVAATTTYHRTDLQVQHRDRALEVEIVGIDPSPRFVASWPLIAGDDARGRAAPFADEAWASEPLAFRLGLGVGDVVQVRTANGEEPLRIAAVYRDYASERGELIVGRRWLEARSRAGVTAIGLELLPGTDVAAALATLRARAAAAGEQDLSIRAQQALRGLSLEIFDRTFAITGVMRLLCLLVAFFGIYSAFAALQFERGREVGLLRCLGARPWRIGMVVVGQTALLGLVAALLALPLGVVVGQLLAHVVNRVSFGWSLASVTVPPAALLDAALLSIVASLLAGVWPAVRFARMRPATALREA